MGKNMIEVAKTPPMGWNSWDCYGASVTEEELMGNAQYMHDHLKEFGWEYVVCDIQWYEPTADSSHYHAFADLEMDEYSRLWPAVNRFPSAASGMGFRLISDQIHEMGLKFGIHIMRGIPRQAVHWNTKILGSTAMARDIAHPFSVCSWNTDMYGVDASKPGAQEYYDSLFRLYAEWGVDYVKVDDICVTEFKPQDLYSAKGEIELIRHAIDACGRDMVLSLSPGPALLEQAAHLTANANMWRMTGDYWDRWTDLYRMFERCEKWAPYVQEHHWPDCDMLPLGHIGIRAPEHDFPDRMTQFTRDEQRTMMTLWCVFRSPLMMGGEMRDNDEFTYSLLTNRDLLDIHRYGRKPRQISRRDEFVVWRSDLEDGRICIAVFNLKDTADNISLDTTAWVQPHVKEIWGQDDKVRIVDRKFYLSVPLHGCLCLLITV